jgi:hypothetical protein
VALHKPGAGSSLVDNFVQAFEIAPLEGRIKKSAPNPTLPLGAHIQSLRSSSEKTVKKLTFLVVAVAFCVFGANAFGQGFDVAFGFGSISAPNATISNGFIFPSERGGLYPGFSADLLVHHRLGVEGELFWKASQGLYGGNEPYRPIFYNFNAIWVPKLSKNFTGEVLAGIGAEDLRFYGLLNFSPFAGYTNYTSSNHFMGDVGGGLRAYFWHDAFIRPEVRLYLINNNVEFSSGRLLRYGVSIGYSFGGR